MIFKVPCKVRKQIDSKVIDSQNKSQIIQLLCKSVHFKLDEAFGPLFKKAQSRFSMRRPAMV